MKWQDIATAPKDGTRVLVWNGEQITVARWQIALIFGMWMNDEGFSVSNATKWQSLPEPPND